MHRGFTMHLKTVNKMPQLKFVLWVYANRSKVEAYIKDFDSDRPYMSAVSMKTAQAMRDACSEPDMSVGATFLARLFKDVLNASA